MCDFLFYLLSIVGEYFSDALYRVLHPVYALIFDFDDIFYDTSLVISQVELKLFLFL
ncbi:hypothetical protein [Blochmannia endosymbiont of Camponotus (Colobopsis) obliquus]|uniref:hypothetical protein n=1 Tax=Blochmannia endosymbiont of Camponotus (Colobopsis) obliquus TaxID=1505597 RepID=UPI000B206245|nr:hypothetical protein [Blochmannia endosymbiont of Camponotus (Colobopsis) obliquus]